MKKNPSNFEEIVIKDYSLRILEDFKEIHISGTVQGRIQPQKFILSKSFSAGVVALGEPKFLDLDEDISFEQYSSICIIDKVAEKCYVLEAPPDKLHEDSMKLFPYINQLR